MSEPVGSTRIGAIVAVNAPPAPATPVAWLRIASAGPVFAVWHRPWRFFAGLPRREQGVVVALGVALAVMNTAFYEAIALLPLATVDAIEFLGPNAVAAWGGAPGTTLRPSCFRLPGSMP